MGRELGEAEGAQGVAEVWELARCCHAPNFQYTSAPGLCTPPRTSGRRSGARGGRGKFGLAESEGSTLAYTYGNVPFIQGITMSTFRAPLAALSLVATALAAQQTTPPQPPPQPAFSADSAAVMQVVERLFGGMRARDTATMRSQFDGAAQMRSVSWRGGPAGIHPVVEADEVSAWLTGVMGAPAGMLLDERIGAPSVRIDGNQASVWVHYEFWLGDRFSHCGADLFSLGRTAEGWRITFVADSRRRTGCENPPPATATAAPVLPPQPPFAVDSAFAVATVRRALDGMRARDTTLMRAQFEGTVPMRPAGWRKQGDGLVPGIGLDSAASWLHGIDLMRRDSILDERIVAPAVEVDANLANVWAYYEFRRGTQFSHCGADQFVLGRTSGGWKIIGVAYSVRRTDCAQSTALTPRQLALRDLVSAERAFALYADTANTRDAFLWALRDDAITFDQGALVQMRPRWQARAPGHAVLNWAPTFADVSDDGTLGVTSGPWTWRPARDSAVQARGQFLTIWRKGPERWQVALDLGVGGDSTADLTEPVLEMPAGVTGRARLSDLTDLDKSRIKGAHWVEALRSLSASDVRILRENMVRGNDAAAISGPAAARFTVLGGTVASSGDLGATWGTWKDGAKQGSFVRIWKHTADGWRVVVDRMGE